MKIILTLIRKSFLTLVRTVWEKWSIFKGQQREITDSKIIKKNPKTSFQEFWLKKRTEKEGRLKGNMEFGEGAFALFCLVLFVVTEKSQHDGALMGIT